MSELKAKRLMSFIQPSDYDEWITYPMVTIAEFGLLLANCNPEMGKYGLYGVIKELEAMNGNIIDKTYNQWPKYKKLLHILRKLDRARTQLTKKDEDLYSDKQQTIHSDSKWDINFLVHFAKKQGFDVPNEMVELDKNLKSELKKDILEPSKLLIDDALLNKIKSSKIYMPLLWIFEEYYKDKKSFQMAKMIEQEIKDKYHVEANKDNDEIYLSVNECQLLNDFMRIIFDLKKS